MAVIQFNTKTTLLIEYKVPSGIKECKIEYQKNVTLQLLKYGTCTIFSAL